MTDGILDLLAAILVLGIVLAIAFGFIIPLTSNDLMQYDTKYEDKAILNDITDYSDSDNFDGISRRMYSYEELVLLFAVQDNRMEEPKEISLRNLVTEKDLSNKSFNKTNLNTMASTDKILQTIQYFGKNKMDMVFLTYPNIPNTGAIRITDDFPLTVDDMCAFLTRSSLATKSTLADSEKRYFITYQFAIPSDAKYLDGKEDYQRIYFADTCYVVQLQGNWLYNRVERDTYKEYQEYVDEVREFAVEH